MEEKERLKLKEAVFTYIDSHPGKEEEEVASALNISLPVTKDLILELSREKRLTIPTEYDLGLLNNQRHNLLDAID